MSIAPVRKLFSNVLGITDKRPFPKFVSRRSHVKRDVPGNNKIIFLPDAFSRYIEPETEQSALEILGCCGYDVQVFPVIGAGASLYSKGFIEAAKRHASKVLEELTRLDPSGTVPIVGIEPPEMYFFKNEYIDLLPEHRSEIEQRVQNTWLLDEYLLRSPEFSNLRIVNLERTRKIENNAKETPGKDFRHIKFHPHCHQRAEGLAGDGLPSGTSATVELLRSCGYEVELLDTGCCGMAGTFGYETEHYDLSMNVGELKLFPMLRALDGMDTEPGTTSPTSKVGNLKSKVLSSGAACRMQIRQGTGVNAVHPIVLVANWLSGTEAV
jgi:Fe-S oxidoreductase